MGWCLVFAVSLVLTISGASRSSLSDSNCDCRPPEAIRPCITDPCREFEEPNSDFNLNCAPLLRPRKVSHIRKQCLWFSRMGPDALNDFLDNVKRICSEHPITPPPTQPPLGKCIPDEPCMVFQNPPRPLKRCMARLSSRELRKIFRKCAAGQDSAAQIQALYTKVEKLCKCKARIDVQIQIKCKLACKHIVFMVDGSNGVGLQHFKKLGDFVKLIMADVATQMAIGVNCTHIGLMSYSQTVNVAVELGAIHDLTQLQAATDNMEFESDVTNTHKAIDQFSAMLSSVENADYDMVGVLLSARGARSWRETVFSMVNLYNAHPDVKMVVVAVDNPRENEVYAIATGTGNDNVVNVNYNGLNAVASQLVTSKIIASNGAQGCTQWAVLFTEPTTLGDALVGVYEESPIGKCYGAYIYRNTNYALTLRNMWDLDLYLSVLNFSPLFLETRWNINTIPPNKPACSSWHYAVSYLDFTCVGCKPNQQPWNEYSLIEHNFNPYSSMEVFCYN